MKSERFVPEGKLRLRSVCHVGRREKKKWGGVVMALYVEGRNGSNESLSFPPQEKSRRRSSFALFLTGLSAICPVVLFQCLIQCFIV